MSDLHERGDKIDRVTLANELMKQGQLQSVDGLSYLVSLDDGLPRLYNLESYVDIVKEKALLRRIIMVSQDTISRCMNCEDEAHQILGTVEDALMKLGDVQSKNSLAESGADHQRSTKAASMRSWTPASALRASAPAI